MTTVCAVAKSVKVEERLGFQRKWEIRMREREREKKVSFKNWYVASSGWSRCHVIIGEALVNFPLWVNFFFNFFFQKTEVATRVKIGLFVLPQLLYTSVTNPCIVQERNTDIIIRYND